ncbi:Eco57I restriction-modification methylase domain-containing protein [Brevibacterium ihuae]|uniref:Eco57I restriction-modification methylase domain-containing protein n=1 Tax=Brevibacterium ihuae TaxID=1631743 RepID=UPI001FE9FBD9|nr:DNA methyltransferase [Brevibacterium ihuae]
MELVDTEGPFIALPVLTKAFGSGIPQLEAGKKLALTAAKPVFDRARDAFDEAKDKDSALPVYRSARDAWVETVLRDVLGWGKFWQPGDAACATTVRSPDHSVEVKATGALRRKDDVGALVWVIDPVEGLREAGTDGWSDSPIDRMELLLREADLPVGIVTDGRWWAVVSAPKETIAASGIVDAQTWIEEPEVRDAFVELLSPGRLVGKKDEEKLSTLFKDSVLASDDITEELGKQVRRAVELVVAALDEAAADARHRGEPDPLPAEGEEIYDAVVTVLMRVVFLLFAQERGLLPTGELYSAGYGLSDQREVLEKRLLDEDAEALDATSLTWHRLLATSQALYAGATFEDLRLPAYGGSLFDPTRFPLLTATTQRGTLAVTVSDRVMLEVLRAVQTAHIKGELRVISFRDIDVEQIGYIYEGLLGYTVKRAPEVLIGLAGTKGSEPEIPLATLNDLYEQVDGDDAKLGAAVVKWVKANQPGAEHKTAGQYAKLLAAGDTMADAEQALRSVTTDEDLRAELRSWIGVIRRDLRGRPVVILSGGLVVAETPSRKNAGAHYTPRALAEEVVLHALEPIVYAPGPHQTADRSAWQLKSSTEILNLKVADIACGSGAFLVAAARYLAARLQEAWLAEGTWIDRSPAERETKALRAVVAHCLYGADINGMAVEMCKLSLWLVSLDHNLPFSFVDDKVLHGNSLLGLTSVRQLEELHIAPKPPHNQQFGLEFSGTELVARFDISDRIQRAIALRQALASEIDNNDPTRSANAKHNQMRQLSEHTAQVRTLADSVIAAGLALGGKPSKKLDEAYENLRMAVGRAVPAPGGTPDTAMLDAILKKGLTPAVSTDYERWQPLHWCLEVPDVMARGGFDAIIGNPPFLGGKKITPAMGKNIREWLVNQIAEGAVGNADLVAYFILRAASLLRKSGGFGLVATNSISQNENRKVALAPLLMTEFELYRAVRSSRWTAPGAVLEIAQLWATRESLGAGVPRWVDDLSTHRISEHLEPAGRVQGDPSPLSGSRDLAYIGCNVNGMGFTLPKETAAAWIAEDERNREVLRPFFGGEELNEQPVAKSSRWVVDFFGMTETQARSFEKPYAWVLERVRPERLKLKNKPKLQEKWWLYEASAVELRRRQEGLREVLAQTRLSKTQMPLRAPASALFADSCVVFPFQEHWMQAVLSSCLHQQWSLVYGSGMRDDPRYTPKSVARTFPIPKETSDLNVIGRRLDDFRSQAMQIRGIGITAIYDLVNSRGCSDPDISELRRIHVDLDSTVMAAYGWGDVELNHGFHTYRQMTRWTVCPEARDEILDRLLEENHRRAALQDGTPPLADDEGDGTTEMEGDQR